MSHANLKVHEGEAEGRPAGASTVLQAFDLHAQEIRLGFGVFEHDLRFVAHLPIGLFLLAGVRVENGLGARLHLQFDFQLLLQRTDLLVDGHGEWMFIGVVVVIVSI